jgi:hypothetical protein
VGKEAELTEATALGCNQDVPSWILRIGLEVVLSHCSPLERLVKPVGAALGGVEST